MSKKATTSLLRNTTKLLGLVFSGSLSSSFGILSFNSSFSRVLLLFHSEGVGGGLFGEEEVEDDDGKGKAAAMVQKGQVCGG